MSAKPLIHLASASPRRGDLLKQIGVSFNQFPVDITEECRAGEVAEVFCLRLALEKARAGRARLPSSDSRPVLGSDTVVALNEHVLGKPANREDALTMLRQLSGHTHEVYTPVALVGADEWAESRLSVSHVTFRVLEEEEIAAYWATGEPADKAGAYGIQGFGAIFVERLEGSYSGVMGLPLFETAELLKHFGIKSIKTDES